MKSALPIWVGGLVAIVGGLMVNLTLINGAIQHALSNVEPPKDIIIEGSSTFWNFRTREIDSLIQNLQDKNMNVKKREAEIAALQARLEAEVNELQSVKKKIEEARVSLSQRIFEVEEAEKKNLKTLASTYTNVAPDAVVVIFSEMEDPLVVKILSNMSSDVVGPIFQAMSAATGKKGASAERAARLSELLRLSLSSKKG